MIESEYNRIYKDLTQVKLDTQYERCDGTKVKTRLFATQHQNSNSIGDNDTYIVYSVDGKNEFTLKKHFLTLYKKPISEMDSKFFEYSTPNCMSIKDLLDTFEKGHQGNYIYDSNIVNNIINKGVDNFVVFGAIMNIEHYIHNRVLSIYDGTKIMQINLSQTVCDITKDSLYNFAHIKGNISCEGNTLNFDGTKFDEYCTYHKIIMDE